MGSSVSNVGSEADGLKWIGPTGILVATVKSSFLSGSSASVVGSTSYRRASSAVAAFSRAASDLAFSAADALADAKGLVSAGLAVKEEVLTMAFAAVVDLACFRDVAKASAKSALSSQR